MTEYNIEKLINTLDLEKNKLHQTKNHLALTGYEIEVLKKYQISYDRYKNEKEILQAIEKVIPEVEPEEQEELDQISMSIAERDYYKNTNK